VRKRRCSNGLLRCQINEIGAPTHPPVDSGETRYAGGAVELLNGVRTYLPFEGGAAQVIGVNVGKYGRQRYVITPEALHTSNAYDPVNHSDSSFEEQIYTGTFHNNALTVLRESFQRIGAM
jgi:hypothetical protein